MRKFGCNILAVVQQYDVLKASEVRGAMIGNSKIFYKLKSGELQCHSLGQVHRHQRPLKMRCSSASMSISRSGLFHPSGCRRSLNGDIGRIIAEGPNWESQPCRQNLRLKVSRLFHQKTEIQRHATGRHFLARERLEMIPLADQERGSGETE
jgi:hypothetical protein